MRFDRLPLRRAFGTLLGLALAGALVAQPAAAQNILRDAETEQVLNDMVRPIVVAAGLDPRNVQVVVLQDASINAFVAGGQVVYVHSGLITAADNANQIQGVVAHELGHMVGGHAIYYERGLKRAYAIMLLSAIAGIIASANACRDAYQGCNGYDVRSDGVDPGTRAFLSFSREQEATADAAGVKFLAAAHISGRGSIAFFKKLQSLESRYYITSTQQDSFNSDHPLTDDRIRFLSDQYPKSDAWDKPTDPALEARFQRVKAKLAGFVDEPAQTLRDYPERDQSIPAHYARAYAYHRGAYPAKALSEADALLAAAPHDPYFLELKGQILLESGKPKDALPPLREAVQITENQPLIAATFGHALVETEDSTNFGEAQRVLRAAVAKDRENPDAWYSLGVVYDRLGDTPHAALCAAETALMAQRWPVALAAARTAGRGLPTGSPDGLRAQDIELVARDALAKAKKKH